MSVHSNLVIAIDGPAGAGKSTVSKMVAKRLGLTYLDTGAMYRAMALAALRAGVSTDDADACENLVRTCEITFADSEPQRICLNGDDVTDHIRTPEIGEAASAISVHPGVRKILVAQQQRLIAQGGVVLEGRDATTVIAPNASLKVFLTASVEERARRRFLELQAKGIAVELEDIASGIAERDHRDSTRADSPLMIADGALVITSDGLTPDEIVGQIVNSVPC